MEITASLCPRWTELFIVSLIMNIKSFGAREALLSGESESQCQYAGTSYEPWLNYTKFSICFVAGLNGFT